MKVKDLVEQLGEADPEAKVALWIDSKNGYNTVGAGMLNTVDVVDRHLGVVYLVGTDGRL